MEISFSGLILVSVKGDKHKNYFLVRQIINDAFYSAKMLILFMNIIFNLKWDLEDIDIKKNLFYFNLWFI